MSRAVKKAMENFQNRLAASISDVAAGPATAASSMGGTVAELVSAVRAVCFSLAYACGVYLFAFHILAGRSSSSY